MSIRNAFLISVLLLVLCILPVSGYAESARFLTVIDGDSLLVEYQGRSREVRLIGIDCPEWGQEYGTESKSHALTFCYGKQVRLEFDKSRKDRYGRMLAYVYCGDTMLNEEMVRAGLALAVKYRPNTKYHSRFKRAEKEARLKRRGFWLHGGLKQTPSQWRKRH